MSLLKALDASNVSQHLKVDGSGRLECSVNEIEVTAAEINVAVDGLETLQTAANSLLTGIDSVLDNSLVKQTAILAKNTQLETLQTGILADTDNIQTLITSTNSKIDTFDAVLDASLVKQTSILSELETIDTGIDVLEACCSSNKVNINIMVIINIID